VTIKIKLKDYKIHVTIINNYETGLFDIKKDGNIEMFIEGED